MLGSLDILSRAQCAIFFCHGSNPSSTGLRFAGCIKLCDHVTGLTRPYLRASFGLKAVQHDHETRLPHVCVAAAISKNENPVHRSCP